MFAFIPPTQEDNTYETQSRITFTASMHENGEQITCEANNPVLEFYNEQPQRASVALSITCESILTTTALPFLPLHKLFFAIAVPPVVKVSPENSTVLEFHEALIECQHNANPSQLNSVRW